MFVDFWPPEKAFSLAISSEAGTIPKPSLVMAGLRVDLTVPTLIWWRLKPPSATDALTFSQVSDRDYAYAQWAHLLTGLRPLFQRMRVLNFNMKSPQTPLSKPCQLAAAAKVGFNIPRTVIGNSLDYILHDLHGDILYKPLAAQAHESANAVLAAKFDRTVLSQHGDNVRQAPAIYQEFIEKDHELRHHVFGRRSFMYKINSHLNAQTAVDWRIAMNNPEIYERLPSDEGIDALCRAYLDEVGLSFGTFDFIVDRSGRLVFLECNPDGQWYGLASTTGADMAGALAEVIAGEIAILADDATS